MSTFEGWYFKHQKQNSTLALIPGLSAEGAFIQIVTQKESYNVHFPKTQYRRHAPVVIGANRFALDGVSVSIKSPEVTLSGKIRYRYSFNSALKYSIMGPFNLLPMECKHDVLSMSHELFGAFNLNGKVLDFTGGKGYIEGDSGRSFPEGYSWVQANDFPVYADREISIMAAAAKIPCLRKSFWGTICIVQIDDKTYRLATYLGAKIITRTPDKLVIRQGNSTLSIEVVGGGSTHSLPAPKNGKMSRRIYETPSCMAWFRFEYKGKVLVDGPTPYASYEYACHDD